MVTRECLTNGSWYVHPGRNPSGWSNYTQCLTNNNITTLIDDHALLAVRSILFKPGISSCVYAWHCAHMHAYVCMY